MQRLNRYPTALPTWILFDFGSFSTRDPEIEVFSGKRIKFIYFNGLEEVHQICAVIRSREYRARETASGPPSARASAQPLPHNPRIQRKNPAAVGPGECFCEGKWRRGWDSNPRYPCGHNGFRDRPVRPLRHLSAGARGRGPSPQVSCGAQIGRIGAGWQEGRLGCVTQPCGSCRPEIALLVPRGAGCLGQGGTGRSVRPMVDAT